MQLEYRKQYMHDRDREVFPEEVKLETRSEEGVAIAWIKVE